MASLALVPKPQTLYSLEEHLEALIDTAELVEPGQEEQFLRDFSQALDSAVAKRDAVGQYLAHLESQVTFAQSEIGRLQERKRGFESALERLKEYVVRAIEGFGPDEKGKYRKLEGQTVTLSIRKCPASVEVDDEPAIPREYKTIKLNVPAELLEQVLDAIDIELGAKLLEGAREQDLYVSKAALKAALESGLEIPGCKLITDRHSLVRR